MWDKIDLENENYEFYIQDEGPGISDDIIKRMGEGFLQDDGVCNGMGLGLHISIKFMNVMKGKISFQKSLGKKGAEVRLCFPNYKLPEKVEDFEIME